MSTDIKQIGFGTGDPDDGEPITFTLVESGSMARMVEVEIEAEITGGDWRTVQAYLNVADRIKLIEFLQETLP